jgi:hypothetical protein
MKSLFILLLSWWPMLLWAQNNITGTIVDVDTGEGVELATVYINGTTKGTYTDENGAFLIENVSFPAEVVVSHLSYYNETFTLEKAPASKLLVKVKPQSVALTEVKVKDVSKRRQNVEEFRRAFLGMDEFGEKASLKNEEVLIFERDYEKKKVRSRFRKSTDQNTKQNEPSASNSWMTIEKPLNLKAKSRAPLIIDQPELGYKIHMDLIEFQLTYGRGFSKPSKTYWLGYYFFEPHQLDKKRKVKRIDRNRLKAYYNSPQHFIRSLYQQSLSENGYRVFEKVEDPETQKVSYEPFSLYDHLVYEENNETAQITGLKDREFLILFYPNGNGYPKDMSKKKRGFSIQSMIRFLDDPCLIRSNGTIPNYQILFGGAISEKKIGAMLPEDYEEK